MILAIGLDAFDYRWADRLEARGYAAVPLAAPVPLSWVAWNTLGTGEPAPSWGISHNPADYVEVIRAPKPRPLYLWEWLGNAGRTSLVVNWPFVLPPRRIVGELVCGYPAGPEGFVVPATAAAEWDWVELDFSNRHGLMRAGPEGDAVRAQLRTIPPAQHARGCTRRRRRLVPRFLAAVERVAPDFAFLGIHDLDRLSHHALAGLQEAGFRNRVLDGILDAVEEVRAALTPAATVVVSDHGLDLFAPTRPGGDVNKTHGINAPDSMEGVLALHEAGRSLDRRATAEQVDLLPMILNRLGIDHNLTGLDRSVPATGGSDDGR